MQSYYEDYYKIPQHYPKILRDALIAIYMIRDKGAKRTFINIYKRLVTRLHFKFIDKKNDAILPITTLDNCNLENLTLIEGELKQDIVESFYAASPSKTIEWAIKLLPIQPEQFTFIDCGSGLGYSMMIAARTPFRKVLGIDFAKELVEDCKQNILAFLNSPQTKCKNIEAQHNSILNFEIPQTPLVVYMFNPFKTDIMTPWSHRLLADYKANPRDIWIIYANPELNHLYSENPSFERLRIDALKTMFFNIASPFDISFYKIKG